jgi:hypothetical protein
MYNVASRQELPKQQEMSSNVNTTTTNTRRFPDGQMRPADSKFCKVCYDAGLPVANYTDHFVKDQPGPNGKVVCSTLLNQACRICQKTGHTSSYCSQYRRREEPRREEPRREERYIEREPRREDRYREERYIEREPRREDRYREERYIEREPRREERYREERYIEREPRREERYREERYIEREPRRGSFNELRDDTERREREIRERDDAYYREQEEQRRRDSTPWLQAVKQTPRDNTRRAPYAHPHGPRVRLNLEAPALSAAKHGTAFNAPPPANDAEFIVIRGHQHPLVIPGAIDVRAVNIPHSEQWGDEEVGAQFNPDEMCEEFLRNM